MNKLVSVIIPCYNAERWLNEAIDSCLAQSYQPIEIIVIDDGSTDSSLDILKSYNSSSSRKADQRILFETGPNRGGNYSRNRGFALSKGQYIQFLDADDYLLPKKIEKQVEFLDFTSVDAVYGDWRHQYHHDDGTIELDSIKVSDSQPDILWSLLSGWWVSPACLLFRRSAVEASGGWDESLSVGQDRDFFLAVVMGGVKVRYQSGCDSIYRRYGNVTVSSSSQQKYLSNHLKILEKYEARLKKEEALSDAYKDALAQSYFVIARKYLPIDSALYDQFLEKALSLSPSFQAQGSERTFLYSLAQKIFGFKKLELLVVSVKRFRKKIRRVLETPLSV
ncbi:glycosyltransferase [cf. Phormidesmis sp. LEGE 11477]|uniref:glycosyltransferase family 2 protein n=1 Tax=cf. Phormidesmis sp. LEGE 11477 TaxID=1828680 RepID=UPI00187EEEDD|nr:glycosyltransferase [cf. Phormidesmis sp. LEGE 11477]MBE9061258.1 glycosyltransferase [cf. Phormidesmis sp. LEGE 11477]